MSKSHCTKKNKQRNKKQYNTFDVFRQSYTLVAPSQVVKKVNVPSSSTSERKTETNQGSNMSGFSALYVLKYLQIFHYFHQLIQRNYV